MLRASISLILLLFAATVNAATIYVDVNLSADCTSGNYSIASYPTSTCTGSDGNAYNDILAAMNASSAGDTVAFRTGSYTNNSGGEGITPKANQVWRTYAGDMPSRATITSTIKRVFTWYQINNVTVRDLILTGPTDECIWAGGYNVLLITNVECYGYNTAGVDYHHGMKFGFAGVGAVVTDNYVHDPAASGPSYESAGLSWGDYDSGHTVERNVVENADMGIWEDVAGGDPAQGLTPHIVRNNVVKNITRYCYHIEVGSTGTFQNNVANGCGQMAFFIRPGSTGIRQLKIQNNTFYNVDGGIHIQQDATAGCESCNIDNNIVVGLTNNNHLLTVGSASIGDADNTFRNNEFYASSNTLGICWNKQTGSGLGCDGTSYADTTDGISSWQGACSGSTCSDNIPGDPLFNNAGGGDFTLQSGSPAKNAGIDVGLPYSGSAPDIGAFEVDESVRNRAVVISQWH